MLKEELTGGNTPQPTAPQPTMPAPPPAAKLEENLAPPKVDDPPGDADPAKPEDDPKPESPDSTSQSSNNDPNPDADGLWEGLEPPKPVGTGDEPKGDVNTISLQEISKQIGVDFSTPDELVEAFKNRGESPVYANDEVAQYVDEINTIAASGGDWKSRVDIDQKIKSQRDRIEFENKSISILDDHIKSQSRKDKEELIRHYHEDVLKLKGNILASKLQSYADKDDAEVFADAHSFAMQLKSASAANLQGLNSELKTLEGQAEQILSKAKSTQEQALSAINEGIMKFEDEDSKVFTEQTQTIARSMLDSPLTSVKLPQKLVDKLMMEDGKLSMAKVMNLINLHAFSDAKKKHLIKKGKLEHFRKSANPADPDAPITNADPKSKQGDNPFGDGPLFKR